MKQEWIDQYNKKCAEFLGYIGYQENPKNKKSEILYNITLFPYLSYNETFMEYSGYDTIYFIEDLQFHSDWNWIMEVVEKINSFQFGESDYSLQGINIKFLIHSRIGKSSKKSVIESIDQFIDWYNKQKKL